jgi:hypothetical protein
MTRRYALTGAQWARIKDLLPGQAGQLGATARDNRLFVYGVLCRYRAGIPWRDLPERVGDFRVSSFGCYPDVIQNPLDIGAERGESDEAHLATAHRAN